MFQRYSQPEPIIYFGKSGPQSDPKKFSIRAIVYVHVYAHVYVCNKKNGQEVTR